MFIRKEFFSISQTIFLLLVFVFNFSYAQQSSSKSKCVDEYFTKLPADFKFDEKIPQKYRITSYFYNRDIAGNAANSIRLTGEFTRLLKEDQIHCTWHNVRIATSQGFTREFSEGNQLDFMDGLSYTYSEEMIKAEFFQNFPDQLRDLMKTLIWDAPWIEVAYMSIDKLKYNEPYIPTEFEGKELQIADSAMLKMKDLRLTWSGLAKIDEKLCALIQYKSFSNPVESNTNVMNVKGRSCYWGSLWVSLVDNQVEHVTLNEDVILKMTFPGNPTEQILNIQRDVMFDKMK